MTWKSLLNGRERELVIDALKQRWEFLMKQSLEEKRRTKNGNDPYAVELYNLATELSALCNRLQQEKQEQAA